MLSSLSRSPTLSEARAAAESGGPEREREITCLWPRLCAERGEGELTSSLRNCNLDSGEVHGFLIVTCVSASTLTDGL